MSFYAPLTTFRRRRYLIAITVIATFTFFYLGIPQWELPHSLKVDGLGPLSRANIVQLTKMRKAKTAQDVDEIYGLLHLVVYKKTPLSRDVEATRPIDMAIYGGDKKLDWAKNVQRLNAEYPIVVFSKSYCPYSRRAKKLLRSYDIHPAPNFIEVDLRDDSGVIKNILTRLTAHSTFPNVILRGKSLGGFDDLQSLHEAGLLHAMLEQTSVVGPGPDSGK